MDEEIIQAIGKWLNQPRISVVIPERMKQLIEVEKKVKTLIESSGLNAEVTIHESALPFGDMVVQVDADDIALYDMETLINILSELINIEIYPIENARLRFAGIFPGVMHVEMINDV